MTTTKHKASIIKFMLYKSFMKGYNTCPHKWNSKKVGAICFKIKLKKKQRHKAIHTTGKCYKLCIFKYKPKHTLALEDFSTLQITILCIKYKLFLGVRKRNYLIVSTSVCISIHRKMLTYKQTET